MHTITRRGALTLALAGLAAPALAQTRYPDRPIRLVIPWPAGGSADAQLRSMGEIAGRALGQPVVVENKPGADSTIAAKGGKPIELLVQRGDKFQTVPITYRGGLRYPWLERTAPGTSPTGLDLLLQPKRATP